LQWPAWRPIHVSASAADAAGRGVRPAGALRGAAAAAAAGGGRRRHRRDAAEPSTIRGAHLNTLNFVKGKHKWTQRDSSCEELSRLAAADHAYTDSEARGHIWQHRLRPISIYFLRLHAGAYAHLQLGNYWYLRRHCKTPTLPLHPACGLNRPYCPNSGATRYQVRRAACVCMQIAPIADAGSAQSRADVLLIGMSGALILTGLQVQGSNPEHIKQQAALGMSCNRSLAVAAIVGLLLPASCQSRVLESMEPVVSVPACHRLADATAPGQPPASVHAALLHVISRQLGRMCTLPPSFVPAPYCW
jgi:hypothetical protein